MAGDVYARTGDTAVVRRLADSLEVLRQTSQFGRDAKLHCYLRGLLFQSQGRHAKAVGALQRSLFSLTDGYTRINLMMARSLLALHRPGEAIAVLRPAIHGGADGSNTYTSRAELHESMALAFEQAGLAVQRAVSLAGGGVRVAPGRSAIQGALSHGSAQGGDLSSIATGPDPLS